MSIKKFVKDHKKAMVGVGVGAAAITGVVLLKKANAAKIAADVAKDAGFMTKDAVSSWRPVILPPTEKLAAMGFDGIDKYVGAYESMTDYGATPADLGKLGEALCELEDIDMNSPVFLLFNVARNKG